MMAAIKALEALSKAVPGDAHDRQQLCARRDHEVDPRLAAQWLAHG
jgi:hypothetical protein